MQLMGWPPRRHTLFAVALQNGIWFYRRSIAHINPEHNYAPRNIIICVTSNTMGIVSENLFT